MSNREIFVNWPENVDLYIQMITILINFIFSTGGATFFTIDIPNAQFKQYFQCLVRLDILCGVVYRKKDGDHP